jgi:hypothetical protein
MEEYKYKWLDKLVGRTVLVNQLAGLELDEEFGEQMGEDPLKCCRLDKGLEKRRE